MDTQVVGHLAGAQVAGILWHTPMRTITLREFFDEFYLPRRLLGASQSCVSKYRRHIRWLSELLGRDAMLADLTDANIAALMQRRLAKGRAPGTVNSVHEQLMALGRFAVLKGALSIAPDVQACREYRRVPTAWSEAELDRLFAAAKAQSGFVGPFRASDWWYGLLSVLWDCGARIGAVLKMRWQQVSFDRHTLILLAETQKQADDQEFELHPDTLAALQPLYTSANKLVFPWPKNAAMLFYDYRLILKSAGLPATRRDLFHKMRRSVASHYKAHGGDPTALLGHSSPHVTAAYIDPKIAGHAAPAKVLRRPKATTE